MTSRAIRYAEEKLGVHEIYEHAKSQQEALVATVGKIASLRKDRRNTEDAIADREMEITAEVVASLADASQAAKEREIKMSCAMDVDLKKARKQVITMTNSIEQEESIRSILESDIRITVARLSELGGYLNFLAAIRAQGTAALKAHATPTKPD